MKKIIKLGILCSLAIGLLTGCSQATGDNDTTTENTSSIEEVESTTDEIQDMAWPRTIQDAAGNEVVLEEAPERISILHATYLDYFFALETPPTASAGASVGDAMKAIEAFETLKPYEGTAEVMDLGSAREINLEAVLESQPDVIVTFNGHIDNTYDQLVKIAPVIQLDISASWQDQVLDVAEIIGKEDLANMYIEETEEIIETTREQLGEHSDKSFALLRVDGTGNFMAVGHSNTIYYDETNGFGMSMPDGYPEGSEVLSMEALAVMDPDYIIFQHDVDIVKAAIAEYEDSSVWQTLKAVENDNVLFFDESFNTGSPLAIRLAAERFLDEVK